MVNGANPPGWYADPTGSFELRYWDGSAWTEHVTANGVQSVSPLPGVAPASLPSRPPFLSKKVVLLASAATAAVVLIVGMLVLAGEYNSEQDDLAAYHASVEKESSHRAALLEQYDSRDRALQNIVARQKKIDNLVKSMKKTDCYRSNPCFGADAWNKNLDKLNRMFDKMEALKKRNAKAVGDVRSVAQPSDLWLLSLLGKDDSAAVKADLERPMPKIRDARQAINRSIDAIDKWNEGCKPNKLITCDAEYLGLDTED